MATLFIDGQQQNEAQKTELQELTRRIDNLASTAKRLTDQARGVLTYATASGYLDDIGAADPKTYLTDPNENVRQNNSPDRPRQISRIRIMLKMVISFAEIKGELDSAEAEALLQQIYGNDTETTVGAAEMIDLVESWV